MAKKLKTISLDMTAEQVDILSDAEAGELFKAILRYAYSDEDYETDNRVIAIAYSHLKAQIDRQKDTSRKRADAANKRWGVEQEENANACKTMQTDANACKTMQTHANACKTMQTHAKNILHMQNDAKEIPLSSPLKENPPTPLKENIPPIIPQERTTKNACAYACEEKLADRMDEFYRSLAPYVGKYGRVMVRAFYDYWSEPNQARTKMRCEMEKTWDTARRLAYWQKRESNNYGNSHFTTSTSTPESRAREVELTIERLMSGQGGIPELPPEMDL